MTPESPAHRDALQPARGRGARSGRAVLCGVVEVFCDGSVTNAVWIDVFESHLGDTFIGRAMVLVPERDYGLIVHTTDGVLTRRGTPDSTRAERFAIETALDTCHRLSLSDHLVLSDCRAAVERRSGQAVEWRSRAEMRLPNDFFDKVLRRASYLRRSKVGARRPAEPHQVEAFELFNAEQREFALSSSALWQRVLADAARHPKTLGTPLA